MLPVSKQKNMKKTTFAKPLVMRLCAVLMLLFVLGTTLVGCSGGTGAVINVTVSDIQHDETVNNLGKLELKEIAEFLASNPEAREAFIAAYRGHDMTAADFVDSGEKKDPDPKYAIKVLDHFDTKDTLSAVVDYANAEKPINAADMLSVINSLKSDIDIKGSRGLIDNIQYGIGIVLGAITGTVGFGSYIVGICLFAIVIELCMLPFTIKQQKNSIKQAMLRPKEMAIRKKYAGRNDQPTQQKIAQEIQDLYARENFNPMGGCLPLLIQFPIIIILYNIVVDPIRYVLGFSAELSAAITTFCGTAKAAGGLGYTLSSGRGTIEALSIVKEKGAEAFEGLREFMYFGNGSDCADMLANIEDKIPTFNIGALNCGFTPSFTNWLWIIPILTFVVYFASMKITRKFTYQPTQATDAQTGCSNNMMDITMPLMSVYIAFITPAAVGIYWIFRSILNTLKSFIMSRVMPLPKFTEEDYKAAEKEMKARAKGQAPRSTNRTSDGTKPRSLHHIDDEDYEQPTPEPKKNGKKPPEEPAETENTSLAPAPLKDEDDKPNHNNEG